MPTIWEDGGVTVLSEGGGGAEGISVDGQIVYGAALDTLTNLRSATIWVRDGNGGWDELILGTLPGTFIYDGHVTCNDMTADNSLIVGYNAFGNFATCACIWFVVVCSVDARTVPINVITFLAHVCNNTAGVTPRARPTLIFEYSYNINFLEIVVA